MGSTVKVSATPPTSKIGARTPMRCIMPTMLCTLYVSVDRRETSEGTVSASVWRAAMRLAMTLPAHAATATASIPTPHSDSASTLRVGATSSIIYAMMTGKKSSATVPTTLIQKPPSIRHLKAER